MSEFLTYKKISDLEQVSEVSENASIPVLDTDGVMKRVPRYFFYVSGDAVPGGNGGSGSGSVKNVIFHVSGGSIFDMSYGSKVIDAEPVIDAFFNGNAFLDINQYNNQSYIEKIQGFHLSGNENYVTTNQGAAIYKFGANMTPSEVIELIESYCERG